MLLRSLRNNARMRWRDQLLVDISREFLDSNGVRQESTAKIKESGFSFYSAKRNLCGVSQFYSV